MKQATLLRLNERTPMLQTVDELSTGMMGNHCMSQRNNYYMLTGVKLSTEFVNLIMEKVDMIVSFLYKIKSIERHATMKGTTSQFMKENGLQKLYKNPVINHSPLMYFLFTFLLFSFDIILLFIYKHCSMFRFMRTEIKIINFIFCMKSFHIFRTRRFPRCVQICFTDD